jgi:hypothetical protein
MPGQQNNASHLGNFNNMTGQQNNSSQQHEMFGNNSSAQLPVIQQMDSGGWSVSASLSMPPPSGGGSSVASNSQYQQDNITSKKKDILAAAAAAAAAAGPLRSDSVMAGYQTASRKAARRYDCYLPAVHPTRDRTSWSQPLNHSALEATYRHIHCSRPPLYHCT